MNILSKIFKSTGHCRVNVSGAWQDANSYGDELYYDDNIFESFDHMNLKEELLRGIYSLGFGLPTPLQQRAIVPCCEGCFFSFFFQIK